MSTAWTITFDCADPAVLSAFWRRSLGYVEGSPPAGFATWEEYLASVGVPQEEWDDGAYITDPDGVRPSISFLWTGCSGRRSRPPRSAPGSPWPGRCSIREVVRGDRYRIRIGLRARRSPG